ncbi:hypothetical protein [Thauera sp.]|uniref:hypothetical protein n=1 Tax=Thauera sp. TaxID=1905334 RepID=UPI002CC22B1F|nr:hypothetical protein [Thauera sp.]HRO35355.1 hypothetical protein [Thauera sp.]
MARIRTVKPEFWTAEQVMELSPMARLLFIGLWNFCDDRGVHPVAYKTLKAEVFPADDFLSSDVERLVGELIAQGLLSEFEAEGRRWWFVTGWHHQVINRPSKSRYPEPPRNAPLPSAAGQGDDDASDRDDSRTGPPAGDEPSVTDHGGLTEDSRTEGKGGEGKGKEGNISLSSAREPLTRKGDVCRRLRHEAAIASAAPHQLPDETWAQILAKRTDEEIVEFAKAKAAEKPGVGLRYLAPGLLDDPKPITNGANHGKPHRRTAADQRADTIAELTGRNRRGTDDGDSRALPGEARIVG